jgi:hypothetical protein
VLGNDGLDDSRPHLTYLVNKTKVNLTESTGHGVKEFGQSRRLIVRSLHDSWLERSITAAGLIADGSGDAVVTSV